MLPLFMVRSSLIFSRFVVAIFRASFLFRRLADDEKFIPESKLIFKGEMMSSRRSRVSFKFIESLHRLSGRLLLRIHTHEDIISQERRGTSGTQIERSRKHENYFKWFHFVRVNCEKPYSQLFSSRFAFYKGTNNKAAPCSSERVHKAQIWITQSSRKVIKQNGMSISLFV